MECGRTALIILAGMLIKNPSFINELRRSRRVAGERWGEILIKESPGDPAGLPRLPPRPRGSQVFLGCQIRHGERVVFQHTADRRLANTVSSALGGKANANPAVPPSPPPPSLSYQTRQSAI